MTMNAATKWNLRRGGLTQARGRLSQVRSVFVARESEKSKQELSGPRDVMDQAMTMRVTWERFSCFDLFSSFLLPSSFLLCS